MNLFKILIINILIPISLFCQLFTNSWVNYNQKYFPIPISKTGIYRITRQQLIDAGFNINSISPKNIQLFGYGQEQYIYIHGEDDGVFNNNDYIEFYAKANDGLIDTLLYENASELVNPYLSLINDTVYYYLTWNNSLTNRRVTVINDTNYSNYQSSYVPYCFFERLYYQKSNYYYGDIGSWYNEAEGWAGGYSDINNPISVSLSTPFYANVQQPSMVSFTCFSASNASYTGAGNHHLKLSLNSTILIDTVFSGLKKISSSIILNDILPTNSILTVQSVDDLNVQTDKLVLSNVRIFYPRYTKFNDARGLFYLPDGLNNQSYIELELPYTSPLILWDIDNHFRIAVSYQNNRYKAIIPNANGLKKCYYSLTDSIYSATVLPGKTFTNYVTNQKADYIIITHSSLWSAAMQYANYRNSTGYSTLVVNVDELYGQYAYGVPKHPAAIQQFLYHYTVEHFELLKHVFILGKGIHSEMIRNNQQRYAKCLIPTIGTPPSDEMFAFFRGTEKPAFSIGRLAAENNSEVISYLNKVMQYESAGAQEWQKRVLHFGGGITTSEQQVIQGYLSSLESIIEDTLYAANVQTFLKTTSLPIQITVSDSIRALINDGCSIMNFFGHASSGGFDQNIDEPGSYENTGRYPLLLANTCLSGDIHLPDYKRISERWVLTPNRGSIAFLASAELGYAGYLYMYSKELYEQFTYKSFAQPVGSCIKNGITALMLSSNNNPMIKAVVLDMTLHGDPAIRLAVNPLPDLVVRTSDIAFVPVNVASNLDTFEVHVVVTNFGKAVTSPFIVRLQRTYSDGSNDVYFKELHHCLYKDTVVFRLPVDIIKGPGLNQFCVYVDDGNWINEYNETNNTACLDFTINIADIVPVYPPEYAIIPTDTITLKASTGYPFIPSQTYLFEIDTTDLFNSPIKLSQQVQHIGGVVTWKPPILFNDCTVYYWRVSLLTNNPNWKESSFIYIPGKTGWSQAHYFQFKKDAYKYLLYNRLQRTFDFINTPKQLRCMTRGFNAFASYFDYQFNLDQLVERSSCSPASAILVVVIDPVTIEPWQSNKDNYGQINYPICPGKNRSDYYFVFPTDTIHLLKLATFLRDSIPVGHYILTYNFLSGNFQQWPEETYQTYEALGAVWCRVVQNNGAYVFFGKKGDMSSVKERVAGPNDTLVFITEIPVDYNEGYIYSTLIGPSTKWHTLHWLPKAKEFPTGDKNFLAVKAYSFTGDSTYIFNALTEDSLDVYDLFNYVDAYQYPYLRLQLKTTDDSLKTPTHLQRWQITYDGVPETAINPEKGFYFYKDTLQEGEILKFAVATENISTYDMDSLLVKYWIQDKNNAIQNVVYRRLRKHPAGDILIDTISINTYGLLGLNRIWYEVNCKKPQSQSYDQLEQTHFNNIAERSFYVLTDKINPLLDVTFDGVRILDGDIVSAKPTIVIQLKDENKFLALNDTGLFAIYLKNLNDNEEHRVYFNNSYMEFYPAQLPYNSCRIVMRPEFKDGKYQLRVQAKDVSNNLSGYYDYTIRFEVITKPSITYIFNYPNPFSSSTRFVFTLTGSELPDDIYIRIFNINGRLVKTIKKQDLGLLHIGRNITEYSWDGTDDFGDKLANGVYFYDVQVRYKGESMEHRSTEVDRFFKHGFGKLYILR